LRPDEALGPKFIVYHDVVAAACGDAPLARARFAGHVSAIVGAGYRFASMAQFLSGVTLESRDVIITVDDGARSFLDVMWPVLHEHGALPTLFVVSGFAGRAGRDVEFLDWDELAELAAAGVEIGCHCVSHLPLNEIAPERMRAEIAESTAELQTRGFTPRVLAYPFGRFDEATKAVTRDAGYEAAFSVMGGGFDRYEIRRRLLTGLEGSLAVRFVLGDAFFSVREAARAVTPRSMLRQEQPIEPERWGPQAFGIEG